MQNLKTRNKFDDETVKYFNKVVEDEVKSRMAELGWKFDEKGNIASLKEQ